MQILSGIYPIAQVREPYTAVGYLSQRLPVQQLLALRHPDIECKAHEQPSYDDVTQQWSAVDICEGNNIPAWAVVKYLLITYPIDHVYYDLRFNIPRCGIDKKIHVIHKVLML